MQRVDVGDRGALHGLTSRPNSIHRRGERFRNVIVPGERLFVHQAPQQADAGRQEAQESRSQAIEPLGPSRPLPVEIHQP